MGVAGTAVDSARFVPAHAGTYRWQSTYSGDATYAATGPTGCADPAAAVVVDKATTVLSAAAVPSSTPPIHGTATLAGGSHPTGTVTFFLTGPDDVFCGGNPVFTSTVAVNGSGTYDSGMFAPTRSGKYTWRASYTGDADNLGSPVTACLDPGASQTVTVSTSTVGQSVPYSVWDQPTTTPLDGIGAWVATVNDPTAAAGQAPPEYLYGHSFRFSASSASGVVGLGTSRAGKVAVFGLTGPEGTGFDTGIAFSWAAGHFYFPFVYGVAPGVWAASLYDFTAATWTPIGSLTVPAAWGKLAPSSATMAIWYGGAPRACSSYPKADVVFSPPVGYVGATSTVAGLAGTTTTPAACPAETSVEATVWARYRLGT
jgi:hypothetical protein